MSTHLSPKLQPWLDQVNTLLAQQRKEGASFSPVSAREALAYVTMTLVTQRPELPWVGDVVVDTGDYPVPVRLYDPAPETPKPVCVYLHGGGHMSGGVTVYDAICRKLAEASGHLVVSVEYRLAPECPYPAAVEDTLAVLEHLWPALEAKQRRVVESLSVAGDSAGGALAATASARLQGDGHIPLHRQILIYPSLDYTLSYPSVQALGQGYFLEEARIRWYFDNYFRLGGDRHRASPLSMPLTAAMPETLVVTAGFCPLRDEGLAYVKRLEESGVTHRHHHFPDMLHAFLNMEDLVAQECNEAYRVMAEFLNDGRFMSSPDSR
ncbi:Acetyl esterase/lipase [Modicisalibacter ilicicola DSM 19980]|uniref:Acetyl esterase/lipase n=1 Tax=Modicisalibacter ilicicola DSM 19980 TaxID=1121942 RepID=A0A1M4WJ43_9GAMM|nr:alpha/beta hydrolase [Halomonas ilicicola]SHE81248.1 Acetyl esterase/lipase [Halomonas ilicicola DSM 19980]